MSEIDLAAAKEADLNEIPNVVYVNVIEELMKNREHKGYEHVLAVGNDMLKRQRRAVLEQLVEIDGCLAFEEGMWRVYVCSNSEDEPMCPVCGAAMRGTVKEIHSDCPLAVNEDGWQYDLFDAKDTFAELTQITCYECGLTFDEHCVEFREQITVEIIEPYLTPDQAEG